MYITYFDTHFIAVVACIQSYTYIRKAVATSPASPVLAGSLFSELKIIFIKIAFI